MHKNLDLGTHNAPSLKVNIVPILWPLRGE